MRADEIQVGDRVNFEGTTVTVETIEVNTDTAVHQISIVGPWEDPSFPDYEGSGELTFWAHQQLEVER